MNKTDVMVLLESEIKGLSEHFDEPDFSNAVDEAERETWSLPVTTSFKILWFKKRAKRHLLSYLWNEYVDKVQHDTTKFQQRFEHLQVVIDKEDKDFLKAQEENPTEFAGVDSYTLFGTYVKSGFRYDDVGRDVTYDEFNEAEFKPSDSDS